MAKWKLYIACDYDGCMIVKDRDDEILMRGGKREIIPRLRKLLTAKGKER